VRYPVSLSMTGLDYADQRYYASSYGRFNTADRFVDAAGSMSPAGWNRYSYTRGDPVNRFDRRGTCDGDTSTSVNVCDAADPVIPAGGDSGAGPDLNPRNRVAGVVLIWAERLVGGQLTSATSLQPACRPSALFRLRQMVDRERRGY
jgi:RHS repeat-associated protein